MPYGFAPTDPLVPAIVWAARALTFFNVLVLLWLGLTVLLNAERRQLGTWLTGGGLLLGGLCSILRAAAQGSQLGQPLDPLWDSLGPPDLWWRASWLPFAGAAYLWSVVLAWYSGRLRSTGDRLGVAGLSLLGCGAFLLLLTARPPEHLPDEALAFGPAGGLPIAAMPGDGFLALAAYVTFSSLCVLHALRMLYHPHGRDRFMGELAARRARPWLTATSLVALGHSLLVGIGVTAAPLLTPWALVDLLGALLLAAQVVLLGQAVVSYEVFTGKTLPRRGLARFWHNALILAAGFGALLAVSLGLPLDQSYRLTLALVAVAVFYALLSWRSFVERERSLEQLRPFVASEHLFEHLLASERGDLHIPPWGPLIPTAPPAPLFHEQRPMPGANIGSADIPSASPDPRVGAERGETGNSTDVPTPVGARLDASAPAIASPSPAHRPGGSSGLGGEGLSRTDPFHALCHDLLGASVGYLFPVGPLASLVGGPVSAPPGVAGPDQSMVAQLTVRIGSARELCLPIEPAQHAGAAWMVPLWSERGLIGLLLLGEKRDGSLYTQEEIEIARAAGERLVDARAARELARRLLVLQRKRLADDHLQDARVRRALHDDVLPLLHTALLTLSARPQTSPAADVRDDDLPAGSAPNHATPTAHAADDPPSVAELLVDAHRQIAGLLADLPAVLTLDPARGGLLGVLRRLVDDLGSELDSVDWQINQTSEQALAALPPLAAEVLFGAAREVIRNAVRHGRADDRARPLHLWIAVTVDGDDLVVRIQDDGVGLTTRSATAGRLAQAQAPGEGDRGAAGSGQGLLLHSTLLTVLGGALTTESAAGRGMRVILRVPR